MLMNSDAPMLSYCSDPKNSAFKHLSVPHLDHAVVP